MIRFEILAENKSIPKKEINEIVIFVDNAGIDELCQALDKLKKIQGTEHLHLSIFGCCDIDLDANFSGISQATLVSQVRIVKSD